MSLPCYPEYKDSGVAWLGKVPRHWDVSKVKYVASRISSGKTPLGGSDVYADFGVVFLRSQNVYDEGLRLDDVVYISGAIDDSMASSRVLAGDVLLNITGASIGRSCVVPDDFPAANVNQHVCVIRVKSEFNRQFIGWFFKSTLAKKQIDNVQSGAAREGLNFQQIGEMSFVLPVQDEQTAITAFLDRETGKIDGLIAEQEKLLTLLTEKRQATISHAVTRGLDPTVPLRDSGVEWLGEVPAHWDVVPLGVICSLIQTGPFGSQLHAEDYIEDGIPVVNPSNLVNGQIMPDWKSSVTDEMVDSLSQHVLRVGDIVFARRGEMGRCALVMPQNAGWLCGTGSLNLRLKTGNPGFVATYLSTPMIRELLKLESVGSTMDNLNAGILARVRVPLPPDAEQLAINIFIEAEKTRLDNLTTEATRAIGLLKERRSALISAAVTGKIDVRNAA